MIELVHFQLKEFECRCGCKGNAMQETFLNDLDAFREEVKLAFVINSGFRCAKHNAAIGGVKKSFHLVGRAADISTLKFSQTQKHHFITEALQYFKGVGVAKSYIHLDNRDLRAFWLYPR